MKDVVCIRLRMQGGIVLGVLVFFFFLYNHCGRGRARRRWPFRRLRLGRMDSDTLARDHFGPRLFSFNSQ